MKKTPSGTSVGVEDPYEYAGVCDHVTSDGRCRYAFDFPQHDPEFAAEREAEDFRCPVVADAEGGTGDGRSGGGGSGDGVTAEGDRGAAGDVVTDELDWSVCPHYRFRMQNRECIRCGLEEHRDGLGDERPLLEEHHLSYADDEDLGNEITVFLCRWCHAKIHNSWASVSDDVNPDPEAIAAKEGRRSQEQQELGFETAAERYNHEHEK